MTLAYKELYLSNDPYYSYTDTLEGVAYIFTFRFSSREQCWYFDLTTADNIAIVLSTKLVPYYPLLFDFKISALSGFFFLHPVSEGNLDKLTMEPTSIADYFSFTYYYKV